MILIGILKYNDVIKKLNNIGEVIIKPSIDSNSGRDVNLLNIKNGKDINSNMKLSDILNKYKKNFLIQERIRQHYTFEKLNPSSVNTIRINTYICDGKVYSSPIAMRIGRNGKIVDNAHAGGLTVGVEKSGTLKKYAFTEFGERFDEHPDTKVKFESYKLPKIKEMDEFAKANHYRIPHMGIVAWDLTLDENEKITLIEANISCPSIWFPQYTTGEEFFGKNTERMIQMLK